MQRAWIYEHVAVAVETIDFLDPAVAASETARERGVRLEVRLVDVTLDGSIYVSPRLHLQPAVCRIDLLEAAPGALLAEGGVEDVDPYPSDIAALAADRDEVAAAVRQSLATTRAPWPEAKHDERGLVPVP